MNSILGIEAVRRKFMKYLFYRVNYLYPQRGYDHNVLLDMFKFEPLELTCTSAAIAFLSKLIHYKIYCPFLLAKLNFNLPRMETATYKIVQLVFLFYFLYNFFV